MKGRVWLSAGPLVAGIAAYGMDFVLTSPIHRATFWFLDILIVKLAALAGALLAASAFQRGDYLRRAWLLVAANYGFLAATVLFSGTARPLLFGLNVVHMPGVVPGSHRANLIRMVLIVAGNIVAVVGTWLLARAWKVAGLETASPTARWLVLGCGLAIAFVLSGIPACGDFLTLVHTPRLSAGTGLASEVGDFLTFALVAPLLLTALALRGGTLGWPWALYTVSQLCWMIFDAVTNLKHGTALIHPEPLEDALRTAACLFGLTSGIAQRRVLA